ncbi:MAG: 30S ribosomal protein S20 [Halanaerobiaceae bacterium]
MPTIESAKKRVKTNAKKQKINKKWKEKYKNAINEMEDVIAEGNLAEAEEKLQETYKIVDKAAQKNIVHKKKAARKKSQLAQKVNELK